MREFLEWLLFGVTCWYGTGYLVTVLLDLASIDKFGKYFFLLPFLWPLTAGRWIRERFEHIERSGALADTPEGVALIEELHLMLKRADEERFRKRNGMGTD